MFCWIFFQPQIEVRLFSSLSLSPANSYFDYEWILWMDSKWAKTHTRSSENLVKLPINTPNGIKKPIKSHEIYTNRWPINNLFDWMNDLEMSTDGFLKDFCCDLFELKFTWKVTRIHMNMQFTLKGKTLKTFRWKHISEFVGDFLHSIPVAQE